MKKHILRRSTHGLLVIFLVSVATFSMMHLMPGDPIDLMVGEAYITQAQLDAIRAQWGLDQPVHIQFIRWIGNMLRGDLGRSVVRVGVPVRDMIADAAWVTIKLNAMAFALSVLVAIPLGVAAATRRYSFVDYSVMVGSTVGVALPNFWFALMLVVLMSVVLGWLPAYGVRTWMGWIMPVMVRTTEQTALLARLMRSSTLEVLAEDYVRTARAKGLSERVVLYVHVLKNAFLPIASVLGFRLAYILSGTIVIEMVFALPGLGRLFVDSIYRLDYQVVQAIVLFFAVLVVLGNLLTDLIYGLIDPRIRIE